MRRSTACLHSDRWGNPSAVGKRKRYAHAVSTDKCAGWEHGWEHIAPVEIRAKLANIKQMTSTQFQCAYILKGSTVRNQTLGSRGNKTRVKTNLTSNLTAPIWFVFRFAFVKQHLCTTHKTETKIQRPRTKFPHTKRVPRARKQPQTNGTYAKPRACKYIVHVAQHKHMRVYR